MPERGEARIVAELEDGESLVGLLAKCIRSVERLTTAVVAAGVISLIAFLSAGALFVTWKLDADERADKSEARSAAETLYLCKRGNGRSTDLILLVEKVQTILGGAGASEKADELVEFAHDQFTYRDCTGDGEITDADLPES